MLDCHADGPCCIPGWGKNVISIFSPVTFGGSVWVQARAASSKGTVSSVPAWFRADSWTNFKLEGENSLYFTIQMEITLFPDRGSNPGRLLDRPTLSNLGRLRDRPTLYRIAIKAGLYRKAIQVCYVPIPGDIFPLQIEIHL